MAQDGAPQGQPGPLRWLRQARSAAENLASDGLRSFHHAVGEVDIQGVDGALKEAAEAALATRPNFAYTQRDIRNDVERLFEMGYFSSCQPKAEDTRDGVRITFVVQPNPEIKGIVVSGANALPVKVLQDAFAGQYGRTLNFTDFSRAIQVINRWYENRGLFGQVADVEMVRGVAELRIAEVAVGKVGLRFLKAGSGEPVRGRTRPEIIMRHVTTKPGQIYSLQQARRDIDSVYSMGLYDDVSMVPTTTEANGPGAPQVDLTLNVVERRSGGLTAGGGISASGGDGGGNPGFIGNLAYSQRNLMGLNQKLTASVELGQSDVLCRLNHTDPWVWGDPHRTSRTVTLQNTRTSAAALLGRSRADLEDAAQERQRGGGGAPHHRDLIIARALCGVEWSRPIREGWTAGAGATLSRVRCLDDAGVPCTRDQYMAPVTFSGTETDLQAVFKAQVAFSPVEGDAQLLASAEYAPPGPSEAWLNFWRMRVRGERQLPIGPCTLVLAGKGGTIKGDLPPYEAFPIGGTNSVRGYEEGGVGTGRQCLVGSAELRWPLLAPVAGCAFIDGGTDLGTGESVSGDPAGTRGKPGMGYGFGAGLRLDSPVGPLRLEYAFNDRGQSRFHFGVGSQM
ncbi:unnamed protein product [Pedinophyceae sp. YPF-701]|nr:unnamed protein product [Pedinophyceae sp. YPF-701]